MGGKRRAAGHGCVGRGARGSGLARDPRARGAWGAALALRLGLARAVQAERGEHPVLLLDDPFSALDPPRRLRTAAGLAGRGQVVVSVADEGHVPAGSAAIWDVSEGGVKVRGEDAV